MKLRVYVVVLFKICFLNILSPSECRGDGAYTSGGRLEYSIQFSVTEDCKVYVVATETYGYWMIDNVLSTTEFIDFYNHSQLFNSKSDWKAFWASHKDELMLLFQTSVTASSISAFSGFTQYLEGKLGFSVPGKWATFRGSVISAVLLTVLDYLFSTPEDMSALDLDIRELYKIQRSLKSRMQTVVAELPSLQSGSTCKAKAWPVDPINELAIRILNLGINGLEIEIPVSQ